MYHISPVKDLTVLEPRVPYMCETFGEPTIPRVCAAPTIMDCLDALGDLEYEEKYFVYEIDEIPHLNNGGVLAAGVCDAHKTNEVWYFAPVSVRYWGTLDDYYTELSERWSN